MHQNWWEDEDEMVRRNDDPALTEHQRRLLAMFEEAARILDAKKAPGAPPWNNSGEDDETPTSRTGFELLGVVLGNTLGFDLKPFLRQVQALKALEQDKDIEF